MPFDFLEELRDVWKQEGVRPNAFMFLMKDKDGNLSGLQGGGLQDDETAVATNAVLAALASQVIGGAGVHES